MTRFRTPWDDPPALPAPEAAKRGQGAAAPKRRGRRPAAARPPTPAAAGAPAWLHHHLTVAGSDEILAAFAAAARGPGVVPWRHDPSRVEEDVLNLLLAQPTEQRNLSAAGCRILARQARMAVEASQARIAAQAGQGRGCPLDLYALLPVPDALLGRGPDDPGALAWMREHWGVTTALRHPALRPAVRQRLPAGHGAVGYGFHTEGETPRAAVAQLRLRWPALRFDLQP